MVQNEKSDESKLAVVSPQCPVSPLTSSDAMVKLSELLARPAQQDTARSKLNTERVSKRQERTGNLKVHISPPWVDSSKGPHRVNRAHQSTKENRQKDIHVLYFLVHGKNGLGWP